MGLHSAAVVLVLAAAMAPPTARAEDVITLHRLSAALASEAVTRGGRELRQAGLQGQRGHSQYGWLDPGRVARRRRHRDLVRCGPGQSLYGDHARRRPQRGQDPDPGGLAKLPHVLLLQGGLRIKAGNEPIGAIGVGGAPGGNLDEACAKAGIDKISACLK